MRLAASTSPLPGHLLTATEGPQAAPLGRLLLLPEGQGVRRSEGLLQQHTATHLTIQHCTACSLL